MDKSLSDITVNVDVKLSKDDLQDSFDIEQTIEDDVYAIYLNVSFLMCKKKGEEGFLKYSPFFFI